MSPHEIQWVTAQPLWQQTLHSGLDTASQTRQMRAPALLRFASDTFMVDLAATLAQDPTGLSEDVATAETYRLPAVGETAPPPLDPRTDLKLFQAAHGHFYLVAASLTCRIPGLPDHQPDISAKDKVGFVLRRLDADGTEWSWGTDPAVQGGRTWTQLAADETTVLGASEEMLPMFPVMYNDSARQRRMYVGLVPTSSGETFKAAGTLSPLDTPAGATGGPPLDPRPAALTAKVTDPLRALAAAPTDAGSVIDATRAAHIVATEIGQLVQASQFLLVDFAELLTTAVAPVWNGLVSGARPADPVSAEFYDALQLTADTTTGESWSQVLQAAWQRDARLTLFGDATGGTPPEVNLKHSILTGDHLDAVAQAWFTANPVPQSGGSGPATSIQGDQLDPPQVPKLDARGRSHYVIRCTYQRPQCDPSHTDVTSDPSAPFLIAGFFDLDAPARPIHISLPIDTGIGDLRKLRKNVNFLISNQLRAQMNRVTDLNAALKGNFADGDSFDLGLICSFSIPVITICALLVLMIFITLLNIVFWWLPFLRICFPIALESKS